MNADVLCPVCGEENSFCIDKREEPIVVREEEFLVPVEVKLCSHCKTEFLHETAGTGLAEARKRYRTKHNMVSPEALSKWREELRITQPQLAAILKWGTATVSRYENGKLAEASHDRMLRQAMNNPDNLLQLVVSAEGLSEEVRHSLKERLSHQVASRILENAFLQDVEVAPGQSVSLPKIANLASAFCEKYGEFETKLNKLFFYADFAAYRSLGRTITGLAYERLQHGPVPSNYRILYSLLEKRKVLELEEVCFSSYTGTKLKTACPWDKNIFSNEEIVIILMVIDKFKGFNATEISELSHKEDAWLKTPKGHVVDFKFAKHLKAI